MRIECLASRALQLLFAFLIGTTAATAGVYTVRSDFESANPGLGTETFDGITPGSGTVAYAGNSQFSVTGVAPRVATAGFGGANAPSDFLLEFLRSGPLKITFNGPVNAVGFEATNGFSAGNSMIADIYDGASLLASLTLQTTDFQLFDTFFGFDGFGSITDLVLTPVGGQGFVSVDNLTFGDSAVGQVPEPASLALFGLGLAIVAVMRKRKPS